MESKLVKRTGIVFVFILLAIVVLIYSFSLGYEHVTQEYKRLSILDRLREEKGLFEPEKSPEEIEKIVQKLSAEEQDLLKKIYIRKSDPDAEYFVISPRDGVTKIAENLNLAGFISNKTTFVLKSKINGFDGMLQPGTHYLKKNMSEDEILYSLSFSPILNRQTFPEGISYTGIKAKLREKGLNIDEEELDDAVNNPKQYFSEFDFVRAIENNEDRNWTLQGYLFPDTYEFDVSVDAKDLIYRILLNTEEKLRDKYFERAKEIGMTMDEVITLASVIENESGTISEMEKVSKVFHNRLKIGMRLESCSTINYIRMEQGKKRVWVPSQEDIKMTSPYNTYAHIGLPPGPICNPGQNAISAALYPDKETGDDVLYFSSTGEGRNVFSTTFEGHLQNINENFGKFGVDSADGQAYTTGAEAVVEAPVTEE